MKRNNMGSMQPGTQAGCWSISCELVCCFNPSVFLNQHHRQGFVFEDGQPCSMGQYPSATIDNLCSGSYLCPRPRSIFSWCVCGGISESMRGMLLGTFINDAVIPLSLRTETAGLTGGWLYDRCLEFNFLSWTRQAMDRISTSMLLCFCDHRRTFIIIFRIHWICVVTSEFMKYCMQKLM